MIAVSSAVALLLQIVLLLIGTFKVRSVDTNAGPHSDGDRTPLIQWLLSLWYWSQSSYRRSYCCSQSSSLPAYASHSILRPDLFTRFAGIWLVAGRCVLVY